MTDSDRVHWLYRPAAQRGLWWIFAAVLALTLVAQFVFGVKGYFALDGWFGFGAVYGFLSCLAMVLFARVLGAVLKRPRDYYPEPGEDA